MFRNDCTLICHFLCVKYDKRMDVQVQEWNMKQIYICSRSFSPFEKFFSSTMSSIKISDLFKFFSFLYLNVFRKFQWICQHQTFSAKTMCTFQFLSKINLSELQLRMNFQKWIKDYWSFRNESRATLNRPCHRFWKVQLSLETKLPVDFSSIEYIQMMIIMCLLVLSQVFHVWHSLFLTNIEWLDDEEL